MAGSIFCLEGEWNTSLKRRESVLPLLELLERLDEASFVHRDVATEAEFEYYSNKLAQARNNAKAYPVVYLASHGDQGYISLGGADLNLDQVAGHFAGTLVDRFVYFAACLVGSSSDDELMSFCKKTGARATVGYSTAVDWLESAAFDLLLLAQLLESKRGDGVFGQLTSRYGSLTSRLGLVVATKATVHRT